MVVRCDDKSYHRKGVFNFLLGMLVSMELKEDSKREKGCRHKIVAVTIGGLLVWKMDVNVLRGRKGGHTEV